MSRFVECLRSNKAAAVDPRGLAGFYRVARVSRKRGYVFANVPKSGGSSARTALINSEAYLDQIAIDAEDPYTAKENAWFVRFNMDTSMVARLPCAVRQGPVFTIVRNPFARSLSAYYEKVVRTYRMLADDDDMPPDNLKRRKRRLAELGFGPDRQPSFEEFLEAVAATPPWRVDQHFAPQSYLTGVHAIPYDVIGRLETYAADMDRISQLLFDDAGLWRRAIESTGRTINVNYKGGGSADRVKREYTERATELVTRYYADDFHYFGYLPSPDGIDVTLDHVPPTRPHRRAPSAGLLAVGSEFALKTRLGRRRVRLRGLLKS